MTPMHSVLIVDDEPSVRNIMARWVAALGLQPKTAASAEEALETLRTEHYDLAVIDVMMPGRDGMWLAGELQRDHPHTAVVIATAYTELLDGDAQSRPIADLLVKPFQRDRFELAVDRSRQWRKQAIEEVHWHAALATEVSEHTARLCASIERGQGVDEIAIITGLVHERAADVIAHGCRVERYAVAVARELGVGQDEPGDLFGLAARFHDVGKAAMPEALLTKPSPLSPGETAVMHKHVEAGARMLAASRTLAQLAPIVLASHEWFGGGGYPTRLAGDRIPLASRIIAVADAYDAMTHGRLYRTGIGSSEAIGELLRCQCTQFDPEIVAAFLTVLGKH